MGCDVNWKNKCRNKITEDERQSIFHGFWSTCCLSTQREYLCKVVEKVEKKTAKTKSTSRPDNTCTIWKLVERR